MKDRRLFLVTILAAIICFSGNVFALLSGAGTQANPYLIQSRADFDEFANPVNASLYWASGKCTTLMCDIDLYDTTYTQSPIAPDTDGATSGFQGTQFTGIFNGNGHVISNLVINQPAQYYIGLFGYIGSGGQVKNLGLESSTISGQNSVGGLCGSNYGTISNCYATGEVVGSWSLGGLCGVNNGAISQCYTSGSVDGSGHVGSLCGYNYGTISNCYATGSVTGKLASGSAGGLCGQNDNGTISQCYATGSVTGNSAGGLCGVNYKSGTITQCYATGAVTGIYAGGLCGGNSSSTGTINQCYSTGSVTGTGYYIGGLCGWNSGSMINSFWDKETSGRTTSSGGTGKTTTEMKSINTFLSASWDFVGETANGTQDIWRMMPNGYPIHSWIEAFALNKTELKITEGETASFEVVLLRAPTADVAINLSISGDGNFELLTAETLVFTAGNWNVPQVVSVQAGFDNNYLNDSATLVIQSKNYEIELPLCEMDVQPELSYDVIVVSSEEVVVQEGNQASFTVTLAENPLKPVEIHLSISGDPYISIDSAAVLSFDSNNYSVPQTVVVKSRWDTGKKDTQAQILLLSPDLQEQLSRTITIIKKDRGKPIILSKPPALLDTADVVQAANVSYLSDDFTSTSDVAWYTYRVASVPGIPGIKGTPGRYVWYPNYGPGYFIGYIKRWEPGTPGRKAVPAKNRASLTFTSNKLSQTGSAWVAIYQKVDSQYKLVKKMLFKQGKSSKLKFVGKADVDYYVSVTPVDTGLGSYSINVTEAAIK